MLQVALFRADEGCAAESGCMITQCLAYVFWSLSLLRWSVVTSALIATRGCLPHSVQSCFLLWPHALSTQVPSSALETPTAEALLAVQGFSWCRLESSACVRLVHVFAAGWLPFRSSTAGRASHAMQAAASRKSAQSTETFMLDSARVRRWLRSADLTATSRANASGS